MSQQKKPVVVEDDVDDLDDVLEQFNSPAPSSKPATTAATPSTPSKLTTSTSIPLPPAPPPSAQQTKPKLGFDDLNLSDDFASELAKGMSELMREIAAEASPSGGTDGIAAMSEEDRDAEVNFRKLWEDMLVKDMDGMPGMEDLLGGPGGGKGKGKGKAGAEANAGTAAAPGADDDAFQRSIRKAMEKLKESETNLQAESAAGGDDPLEALLSSLGEGGGETEEELQGILESMMTQLMSKDILYEPLKELHEKFPKYLRDNADKINPDDKKRYDAQQALVTQILAVFDSPSYSDSNPEQGVKVVSLMNEMQSHGSPPAEIMGPLPPGLDMGADGLPKLPDNCSIM
ncbi:Pex19-domain-containing protein [Cristinia sonorae]|uniref:Pex19-domain-containing protein n=1 Tax=Cristinia sonorae TaxID=1940300 RepID=A0A8K0UGE5_9AGAR|nr:Pex19-domain-containing protein [Cristinia sonorae]